MKKVLLWFFLLFFMFSCNKSNEIVQKETENKSGKLDIVTSIIPLASITNYIWWDYVSITNIIPAWTSPHSFDIKTNQAVQVENSDLVIYTWLEHIDWFLDKLISWKDSLAVSSWITLIKLNENEIDDDWDDDKNTDKNYDKDPHIWLWITNAKIIAESIKEKLTELKPEEKDYFQKNYDDFVSDLDKVSSDFKEEINWKKMQNFIVFHNAYNYLFSDLWVDFNRDFVFMPNILTDMNSVEMKNLQDDVTKYDIKFIFKEPQLDSSNLLKFSSEFNLQVLNLDPLGEDTSIDWYINNLKNNLINLEKVYE